MTESQASGGDRCSIRASVLLEIFVFDFAADLYGEVIDVAFIDWIRPELKFDTVEELVRRMHEDSRLARQALARAPDAFPPLGELADWDVMEYRTGIIQSLCPRTSPPCPTFRSRRPQDADQIRRAWSFNRGLRLTRRYAL